jgi:hypothetical protein
VLPGQRRRRRRRRRRRWQREERPALAGTPRRKSGPLLSERRRGDKGTGEKEARPEECWLSVVDPGVDVVSSSPATFSSTTSCLVSNLKYRACPLPLPRLCNVHIACTDCKLHPRNGRVIAHLLSIRNYPLESSRLEEDGWEKGKPRRSRHLRLTPFSALDVQSRRSVARSDVVRAPRIAGSLSLSLSLSLPFSLSRAHHPPDRVSRTCCLPT